MADFVKQLSNHGLMGVVMSLPSNADQRRLCVRDLVIEETGTWNVELLIQLFGHQNCMTILSSVRPPMDGAGKDKLIFKDSTSGVFSVKAAYNKISQNSQAAIVDELWKMIWKRGNVLPRVRIFFWKLMHSALPLAKTLDSRMSRGDSTCAVCQQGEEDVLHMLFFCSFARGCWLLEPLALHTENLPHDLSAIIRMLNQQMSEEVWTAAANQAWAIWRCRNEKVYGGQDPTFERFTKLLNTVCMETRIATSAGKKCGGREGDQATTIVSSKECCCKVDGSWKPTWRGGLGFIVEGPVLKGYRVAPCNACCPIQAEAVALKEALLFVRGQGILSCTFFTDNQSIACLT